MVYESVVDEASGGIDLFWVLFSLLRSNSWWISSLGVRQVKKGRFSVAYGYLERSKHQASTGSSARNIAICLLQRILSFA